MRLFGIFLIFCLMVSVAQGAVIDPGRKVDWQANNVGVTGGIPTRTTICSTLTSSATTTTINNAIAACPSGQVVFLSAGTYSLTGGIDFNNHSGVTLRGAGPDQTKLVFNGSGGACTGLDANICLRNGSGSSDNPGTVANWTAGYSPGTTSITLSTTTGLSIGDILVLDQLDDTNTDTGDVWVCQTINVCATEGGAAGRASRAQMQFVKVTNISGTTVSITPGIQMPNWRSGRSPQAWWVTPITGVGVEDLSVDYGTPNTGAYTNFFIINCYDCWVTNVRSLNANRNHIWLYEAVHTTIHNSYFYGTLNAASQSYGVETRMASDNLIENNIFEHITTPMMTGNANGIVWAYNYSIDDFYSVTSWMQASSYFHDGGVGMILWEGNIGPGFDADDIHGTSHFGTMFRNYWIGWETGKTQQTAPIILYTFNRYMNLVGNVLGRSGFHTQYESLAPSGVNANVAIYVMGWSGNEGSTDTNVPNDVKVAQTTMRWGNYDTVNAAARFVNSEVPSGISPYPNPVPPDQTLPTSYYLSSKPAWFGSVPWPPIGPDVTGGTIANVGGHAYKIPAQVCYESLSLDGANPYRIFTPSSCYAAVGGGNVPTILRVIR